MKLALKAKKKKEEQKAEEEAGKRQRVGFEQPPVVEDDSDDLPLAYDGKLGATWVDKIVLDRRLRFCLVMTLFAIVTPCLLWYFLYEPPTYYTEDETCNTYPDFRTPCFNEDVEVTERACLSYLCCYDKATHECYHTHRSQYDMLFQDWDKNNPNSGKIALAQARKEGVGLVPKRRMLYDMNLAGGAFTVRLKGQVLQLQLRGKNEPAPPQDDADGLSPFDVTFDGPEFAVQVQRERGNVTLLSTSMGPTLVGSAGRWDLVLRLAPNASVVGAHADAAAAGDTWLYPSPGRPAALPTLLALEAGGGATAVRLAAAAPVRLRLRGRGQLANILQVRLLAPLPAALTIEVASGSTPADALRALRDADGATGDGATGDGVMGDGAMGDWALGLVICPAQAVTDAGAGQDRLGACERFKEFLEVAKISSLPWDAHCVEQSFMWENGTLECLDQEHWDYIGDRKLIAALPNAVRLNEPAPQPSVLMAAKGFGPYVGGQLDIDVHFPDWTAANSTKEWAAQRIGEAFGDSGVSRLAGVALVQNWPLDSGPRMSSSEEDTTEDNSVMDADEWEVERQLRELWEGTLHGRSALHGDGRPHYSWHARALDAQVAVAAEALRAAAGVTTPLVFTDGAGPAAGEGAGAFTAVTGALTHAAEAPSWAAYRAAAAAALGLAASGVALAAGDPVCGGGAGFDPSLEEQLEVCERWFQQASALPLMWVASPPPHRHPAALPPVTRARAALAVRLRYALLPYLRTAAAARALGALPHARPLVLEFPLNAAARAVTQEAPHAQWMLGPALLVAPAAASQLASVQVFLPALEEGKWRFFYGGNVINTDDAIVIHEDEEQNIWGHTVSINLENTRPIILIRPGFIVPQCASAESATSVSDAVRGGIKLTASAECTGSKGDADCSAGGDLRLAAGDAEPLALRLSAAARAVSVTWAGNSSACVAAALKAGGHGDTAHKNDANDAPQGTKAEARKTKEDVPAPSEDQSNVLKELDVYGVPSQATTKLSDDDVVTVTVKTLNGTLLPDVVSRLSNGRLTLSSIGLDMCSDGGGIIATW